MIYRHFVGMPSNIPDGAKLMGETMTHYRNGTEWVRYYSDDPECPEDMEIFRKAKAASAKYNSSSW